MPYDEPDASDPSMLVGVAAPGDSASDLEMAYTFAEELAGLGYGEELLLRLFASPRYPGLHRLSATLGEQEIRRIVRECCDAWAPVRVVVTDAPDEER